MIARKSDRERAALRKAGAALASWRWDADRRARAKRQRVRDRALQSALGVPE